jgi:hypothetical protein
VHSSTPPSPPRTEGRRSSPTDDFCAAPRSSWRPTASEASRVARRTNSSGPLAATWRTPRVTVVTPVGEGLSKQGVGHHHGGMQCRAASCCLLLVLTGCTATPHRGGSGVGSRTHHSAATATGSHVVGQPGCRPPSPVSARSGFPEVHATSQGLQMWGLVMAQHHGPLRVHEDLKIVWRITGSGQLHLVTLDPGGRRQRLQWGPDLHSGSSYTRPGDEWGAGYRFTRPGCWTLRATRGKASATTWLMIAP